MAKSLYPAKETSKEELMIEWIDNHAALFIILLFIMSSILFAILFNVAWQMCMCEHVVNYPWV